MSKTVRRACLSRFHRATAALDRALKMDAFSSQMPYFVFISSFTRSEHSVRRGGFRGQLKYNFVLVKNPRLLEHAVCAKSDSTSHVALVPSNQLPQNSRTWQHTWRPAPKTNQVAMENTARGADNARLRIRTPLRPLPPPASRPPHVPLARARPHALGGQQAAAVGTVPRSRARGDVTVAYFAWRSEFAAARCPAPRAMFSSAIRWR